MPNVHTLSPGFHVAVRDTGSSFIAVAKWRDGAVALRVSFASIERAVIRAIAQSGAARAALIRILRNVSDRVVVGGVSEDLNDVVIGSTKRERMARRRRKRKERRKRVARRFRNTIKKIARAIAKLKILDRLRGMMRKLQKSKLLSGLLRAGATAAGGIFGGPMGAMMGASVVQQMFPGTSPMMPQACPPQMVGAARSMYALGCST